LSHLKHLHATNTWNKFLTGKEKMLPFSQQQQQQKRQQHYTQVSGRVSINLSLIVSLKKKYRFVKTFCR